MRGRRAVRRVLSPDPVYNSRLITKFINRVMFDGKKSIARNLVYKALEKIEDQTKKNPVQVFEAAIANVAPRMEVRPRRVGGASYQVPVEVRGDRREALAIRWLITAASSRSSKEYHTFDGKLAVEFIEAAEGRGAAIKKREDSHKAAEANKAFSHFRW